MNNKKYVFNKKLVFLMQENKKILYSTVRNWETEISDVMYEFLYTFFIGRTIESGLIDICKKLKIDKDKCEEIIEDLIAKEIIIEFVLEQEFRENKRGMFGTDSMKIHEVINSEMYDVVFLGMPYDLNTTYKNGSRFASEFLRKESKAVFEYKEVDGNPCGMYDPTRNKYILKGVRLADCGDISSVVFQRNGREFDYLEKLIRGLSINGSLPVVIGGDHSISLATIRGAAHAHEKIGVLHFDAHDDYGGTISESWREACHHGNFVSWIVEEACVSKVVQIGVRQLSHIHHSHHKIENYNNSSVEVICDEIIETLSNDIPYYISFDVDCMEPYIIKSTGTPLPGGFSYKEVIYMINRLCSHYEIIGIDIVELIPSESNEGIIVSGILLEMLKSIFDKELKND